MDKGLVTLLVIVGIGVVLYFVYQNYKDSQLRRDIMFNNANNPTPQPVVVQENAGWMDLVIGLGSALGESGLLDNSNNGVTGERLAPTFDRYGDMYQSGSILNGGNTILNPIS